MSNHRNRRIVLSVLIAAFIIISAGLAALLLSWNFLTSGVQAQSGGNRQFIPFVNKPVRDSRPQVIELNMPMMHSIPVTLHRSYLRPGAGSGPGTVRTRQAG